MGITSRMHPLRRLFRLLLILLPGTLPASGQTTVEATTVPLLLPGGLAYDTAGNLYFAETTRHVVRRVSSTGALTTIAGTGTQGFSGDGGAAALAMLDSPAAVALDAAGNLYIADTHNHRIRKVDAVSATITTITGNGVAGASPDGTGATAAAINLPVAIAVDPAGDLFFADAATHLVRRIDASTGLLRTVAGSGIQGYSGDGAAATLAEIDSPWGIALDLAGNIYLADTHNHRIRRVDAASGVITTIAGDGQPGFAGDAGAATGAKLNLPHGLALDASGGLWIVDSLNQRIRHVDATTGHITTIAGDGTQGFSGDGGPAVSATLNTPRAVALTPGSLPVFSDSGNARVREVDSSAIIHTIAGLGATGSTTLSLAAPSVVRYGTGSVIATLAASPATGSITFFDTPSGAAQLVMLGSAPLQANTATNATSTLAAGVHSLSATYPGDTTHQPAASNALALTVAQAPAVATINPAAMLYGQPVPALSGTIAGVLAQDAAAVSLTLNTTASPASTPGSYAISATLTGTAAGNYALTQNSVGVTISKAPVTISLPSSLTAQINSTTSGTPTGIADLLDGGNLFATAQLSANGAAVFASTGLSTGSHTLTALYSGDTNFLSATSAPLIVTIGGSTAPDFTLASASASAVTIPAGNAATWSFTLTPVNGAMSGPILLTVNGLPTGTTASFSPAYLLPGTAVSNFTLTIQSTKLAEAPKTYPLIFAAGLPILLLYRRRRSTGFIFAGLMLMAGCGNRINEGSTGSASAQTYNLTVLATSTGSNGATVQHTVLITLTLQ